MKRLLLLPFVGLMLLACGNAPQQKPTEPKPFKMPDIPVVMTNPADRAQYLVTHYWDNFDFADTVLIRYPDITEQAFVNYIEVLPHTDSATTAQSLSGMLDKAMEGDSLMFAHFVSMAEKYFYDPNSPFRNEEFYIPVLRYIVASPAVGETEKIRPGYQLDLALKNRVGESAVDFTYTLADGRTAKLSGIRAEYTLIFFNNPDCPECKQTKAHLLESPVFRALPKSKMTVLSVYPDEDLSLWQAAEYPAGWIKSYDAGQVLTNESLYDLRASPTLYLLDRDKRVVLKDPTIQQVEAYFSEIGN